MATVACLVMWGWLAVASLAGATLAVRDKRAARQGRRRVRERTLHLWALAGGWPGLAVAFALARHKTRKPRFLAVFMLAAAASLAALVLLARGAGCGLPGLSGS